MTDLRKPLPLDGVTVKVRYSGGAYQTQTVRGCRASSTSSPEQAARVLACKLWADRPTSARAVQARGLAAGISVWRVAPAEAPQ